MTHPAPRFARTALLAASLVLLGASETAAQLARLEGMVTDETGAPLEGVEIYLKSATTNALLKPAKTSKKGRYLYLAEPGPYYIFPKLDGYWIVRQYVEIVRTTGDRQEQTHFFDDKQAIDKTVGLSPSGLGDVTSKGKNRVDFVMATPDKHTAVVNKLYAEYKGLPAEGSVEGEGGGTPGTPPAGQAPPQAEVSAFEAAVDLLARKDYAGAVPLLKQAVEKDPEDAEACYQLGKAALELEDFAEAEPALKRAKQLDPTKPGVGFHLARLYDKKGRKIQAVQALEDEKALSPDSEAVLSSLASLYAETGQPEKAIETYESLIALNPESFDSYLALAALHKERGDRAKEEEVYKRMGDRDPTGQSFYNLGNLAFNRDEREKASLYYRRVIEKNPKHAMAHYQLANTLIGIGDLTGAVNHLEAFLKLSPKDAKAPEARKTVEELKRILGPAARAAGKS